MITMFKIFENTKLNYSNKDLTELSELPDNLEQLECYVNQLISLPELPDTLEYLNYKCNKLIELPKLPDELEMLLCQYNKLSSLPKLPNNLIILYCYNNRLTSLPKLPNNLITLYCYNNELTSLPKLPDSLITLHCYNNNFKEPLKGVDRFKLHYNIYSEEQIELFRSYEFQKEYIQKDPSNYFNLKHLGIHLKIEKEFKNINSIEDMGVIL